MAQAVAQTLETTLASADGTTYTLKLACDETAGIPEGARLRLVELNQALDREEAAREENKSRPYDSERFVSAADLQKRGEVLDRYLELGEDGYRFYTKHLEVSLEVDGEPVVPAAPVELTLETTALPRERAGCLELAWKTDVDHPTAEIPFGYQWFECENVTDDGDETSKVRFSTDMLGELAVAGVAYPLSSWDVDGEQIAILGRARFLLSTCPPTSWRPATRASSCARHSTRT